MSDSPAFRSLSLTGKVIAQHLHYSPGEYTRQQLADKLGLGLRSVNRSMVDKKLIDFICQNGIHTCQNGIPAEPPVVELEHAKMATTCQNGNSSKAVKNTPARSDSGITSEHAKMATVAAGSILSSLKAKSKKEGKKERGKERKNRADHKYSDPAFSQTWNPGIVIRIYSDLAFVRFKKRPTFGPVVDDNGDVRLNKNGKPMPNKVHGKAKTMALKLVNESDPQDTCRLIIERAFSGLDFPFSKGTKNMTLDTISDYTDGLLLAITPEQKAPTMSVAERKRRGVA